MKQIWIIFLAVLLVACNASTITDRYGNKYQLISNEVVLNDVVKQPALYKRVKPLDEKRVYIKSLISVLDTNAPLEFVGLMK